MLRLGAASVQRRFLSSQASASRFVCSSNATRGVWASIAPSQIRRFGSGNEIISSPGVDHVVLLKVKQDTSQDQIDKLYKGVESLTIIPGVVSVVVGDAFLEQWMGDDRRGGYTHYLRVRLESKDALQIYQDDEYHTKVKTECIAPILVEPPLAIDCDADMKVVVPE